MRSSKPLPFTYISFLERLTKQNISQLLFNLALYLSFILPLASQVKFPVINSPWKDISNEIALIFLLSGFGFIYWISGIYIRRLLISVRIELEFGISILGAWLGVNSRNENSPRFMYVNNNDLLSKYDIISYLSRNENSFLEKLYWERLEMNKKYHINQENTVVTLTLFSLHWYFKSEVYLIFTQYIPDFLPVMILLFILYSSAEPFPQGNDYFLVPGNPIRHPEDSNST